MQTDLESQKLEESVDWNMQQLDYYYQCKYKNN